MNLNPTYLDFPTSVIITVTANSTANSNDELKVEGWAAGELVPSTPALTSLVFTNSFNSGTGSFTSGEFFIIKARSETITVQEKISDWVTVINGIGNDLSIKAVAIGTDSFMLYPNDKDAYNIQDESLYIDTSGAGTFIATLDHVNDTGVVYVLFKNPVSFEVFLEGRVVQPAATSENWAVLLISDSAVVGREFGNTSKGLRSSGSIRFKLYAPRNAGTKQIREMADELNLTYNYTTGDSDTTNGGTLFIKAGSLSKVSDDEDGKLSYNLDYIYDYYTS